MIQNKLNIFKKIPSNYYIIAIFRYPIGTYARPPHDRMFQGILSGRRILLEGFIQKSKADIN